MIPAQEIRELVARDTILMPGVYDALTARIAARVGFEIVFISGYSVSAGRLGEQAAIERCLAYKEAGADALFVEAPQSVEELEQIAEALPAPLVANMIERGVTPHLSRSELRDLGYQLIVCPLAALYSSAKAV